jgi:hypothetical protein
MTQIRYLGNKKPDSSFHLIIVDNIQNAINDMYFKTILIFLIDGLHLDCKYLISNCINFTILIEPLATISIYNAQQSQFDFFNYVDDTTYNFSLENDSNVPLQYLPIIDNLCEHSLYNKIYDINGNSIDSELLKKLNIEYNMNGINFKIYKIYQNKKISSIKLNEIFNTNYYYMIIFDEFNNSKDEINDNNFKNAWFLKEISNNIDMRYDNIDINNETHQDAIMDFLGYSCYFNQEITGSIQAYIY